MHWSYVSIVLHKNSTTLNVTNIKLGSSVWVAPLRWLSLSLSCNWFLSICAKSIKKILKKNWDPCPQNPDFQNVWYVCFAIATTLQTLCKPLNGYTKVHQNLLTQNGKYICVEKNISATISPTLKPLIVVDTWSLVMWMYVVIFPNQTLVFGMPLLNTYI